MMWTCDPHFLIQDRWRSREVVAKFCFKHVLGFYNEIWNIKLSGDMVLYHGGVYTQPLHAENTTPIIMKSKVIFTITRHGCLVPCPSPPLQAGQGTVQRTVPKQGTYRSHKSNKPNFGGSNVHCWESCVFSTCFLQSLALALLKKKYPSRSQSPLRLSLSKE